VNPAKNRETYTVKTVLAAVFPAMRHLFDEDTPYKTVWSYPRYEKVVKLEQTEDATVNKGLISISFGPPGPFEIRSYKKSMASILEADTVELSDPFPFHPISYTGLNLNREFILNYYMSISKARQVLQGEVSPDYYQNLKEGLDEQQKENEAMRDIVRENAPNIY
jgi:hypothetical protein